jgi:phage regulator Rha-like protein
LGASDHPPWDGKTFADSRDVAATFGKNHRDVLAAIRDLIEKVGEIDLRNFTQINFTDAG